MKYKQAWGSYPIKAEQAAYELNKLKEITPERVVSLAKNKSNPLHNCFEWDDKKAAKGYRILQAEKIIRSIIIVDETEKIETIRAYISVEETRLFKSISDLNDNDIDFVVQSAYKELKSFRNKYSKFKKLREIIQTIDKLLKHNNE